MHQDHVPQLPEGFELLASSPICLVHGMVKMSKSGEEVEILTVQGSSHFLIRLVCFAPAEVASRSIRTPRVYIPNCEQND